MPVFCRVIKGGIVSGEGNPTPLLDDIRRSANPVSSTGSMAQMMLQEIRSGSKNDVFHFVECGYDGGAASKGPFAFYSRRSESSRPPLDRSPLAAQLDGPQVNVMGAIASYLTSRFQGIGAYISIVAFEPHSLAPTDLIAPFVSAEISYNKPLTAAVAYPVAVEADIIKITEQVVSTPSVQSSAPYLTFLVIMLPATSDLHVGAISKFLPRQIPLLEATPGSVRMLFVPESHHVMVCPLLLDGASMVDLGGATGSVVDELLHEFKHSLPHATVVLRLPSGMTSDELGLRATAAELAAFFSSQVVSAPSGEASTPKRHDRPVQSPSQAPSGRLLITAADEHQPRTDAMLDVLEKEVRILAETLKHREKAIALAKELLDEQTSWHNRFRFSIGSVDESLRRTLSEASEMRKLQRDLLADIECLSDKLIMTANVTEQARRASIQLSQRHEAMSQRLEAATREKRSLLLSRETLENELDHLRETIASLKAAAEANKKDIGRDNDGETKSLLASMWRSTDEYAAETVALLGSIRKSVSAELESLNATYREKEREARQLLDALGAKVAVEEDQTAAIKSKYMQVQSRLHDAERSASDAKQSADGMEASLTEAQRAIAQYDQVNARVGALRGTLADESNTCTALEATIRVEREAVANATNRLKQQEGRHRHLSGTLEEAMDRTGSVARETLIAEESLGRHELCLQQVNELLELHQLHRVGCKSTYTIDGSAHPSQRPYCRTCALLQRDADQIHQLQASAIADERRAELALIKARDELSLMVDKHAAELTDTQSLVDAAMQRVHALRREASLAHAGARRCVEEEEERLRLLAEEFARQIHKEVRSAVRRQRSDGGTPSPPPRDPSNVDREDEQIHSGGGFDSKNCDDTVLAADLYLQWCSVTDDLRANRGKVAEARSKLTRLERSLHSTTAALATDRKLASELDATSREIEERLRALEQQTEADHSELAQHLSELQDTIHSLHNKVAAHIEDSEREIALADAAVSSLNVQLVTLSRDANRLAAKLETSGEPISSLEQQVAEVRRRNDALALELFNLDGTSLSVGDASAEQTHLHSLAASSIALPADFLRPAAARHQSIASEADIELRTPYTSGSTLSENGLPVMPSPEERENAMAAARRIVEMRRQF